MGSSQLKVGDSIDGEYLDNAALSGTRLEAFIIDGNIVVVEDEGNFNYKVLAIIKEVKP